jgi:hypothetical protein
VIGGVEKSFGDQIEKPIFTVELNGTFTGSVNIKDHVIEQLRISQVRPFRLVHKVIENRGPVTTTFHERIHGKQRNVQVTATVAKTRIIEAFRQRSEPGDLRVD